MLFTKKSILALFVARVAVLMLMLGGTASAGTFFVDLNFQGDTPTGTSWLSAFPTLQAAINAAAEEGGGDVWVKAGVYQPDGSSRNSTFALEPNVSIFGGFAGGETTLEERNYKANRTILSGDIGRVSSTSDNCYHVLLGATDSRIDGFIISRGNANSSSENRFGGGLLVPSDTLNAVVANCTFEKNTAESGGAFHAQNSQVVMTNCTFYSNSAAEGGAITLSGSTRLLVQHSSFSSNFAPNTGGAVSLTNGASARFEQTSFLYNSTDGQGGALVAQSLEKANVEVELFECIFKKNSARSGGGALSFSGAFSPQISNCTFDGNFSTTGAKVLLNAGGIVAVVTNPTFSANRGEKGSENIKNDDTSRVTDSQADAIGRVGGSKLSVDLHTTESQPAVVAEPEPAPKPTIKLANESVHNTEGVQVTLSSVVAANEHTVLVLGDLTDSDFIESYRNIEAAATDYYPKGIRFHYIYRHLRHPENNGYIQPFNLKERAQHVIHAKKKLSTRIPWLCDLMDNQTAKSLSLTEENSVFIFNAKGEETYSGPFSDNDDFLKALAAIAGIMEPPTSADTLAEPTIEPLNLPTAELVTRITVNPEADHFLPLQVTPLESKNPCFVKVRAEGNEAIRTTGDGKIYLGFHIDPLYKTKWNNLADPLSYALKTSTGVVAPSINQAPRVTAQATDMEPREFLLDARKLDITQPITLQVSYSIHSTLSKKNISVTQQYRIKLQEDPFGGKAFGRQIALEKPESDEETSSGNNAFTALLRRFDLDRNGNLTEDEVIGGLRSNFQEIDTNSDGAIVETEYMFYRENH